MTALISGDAIGENNTDPSAIPTVWEDRAANRSLPRKRQTITSSSSASSYDAVVFQGTNWQLEATRVVISSRPGLGTLDVSVFKNNYIRRISESFNAQFRFEAFNVLNRPNFSPADRQRISFRSNGSGDSRALVRFNLTTTTSRQLQVALKIIW